MDASGNPILQPPVVAPGQPHHGTRRSSRAGVEQASNESSVAPFLDPFDPAKGSTDRRPGLIWMFWSSTRGGNPDIYMQTIAPHFGPVPASSR